MPQAGGASAGLHWDVLPQAKPHAGVPAVRRVLIVDDSKFVRTTFKSILSASFAVREEADGEAAWQVLATDPSIAMVFTDLDMPRLDGFGLLARLRGSEDRRLRELPVVIISGNEQAGTKERARRAGASDFISKSAEGSEVLARIENLLRLVRTRKDLEASREALARTATHDPLTGALTMHALVTEGRRHFALARRQGAELALMALRMENLDELARQAGKEAVEQLLARITKLMAGGLRAGDCLGRVAAGTFVLIAPSTAGDAMLAVAQRLREQLQSAQIRCDGRILSLRCGFGVASLVQEPVANGIEDLMRLALKRIQAAVPAPSPPPSRPRLDAELERAVRVLEAASAQRLGERSDEVLRRLLPFLVGAFRRLEIELPTETIAKVLKGRQQ